MSAFARGLALVVLLCASAGCSAHRAPAGIWLAGGLGGASSAAGEDGGALMGQLVYQPAHHYLALRALGVLDPFDSSSSGSAEFGVLYGRAVATGFAHAAAATGIALTVVGSCQRASGGSCTTAGLPLSAEAAIRPVPVLGLGAQAFANLNPRRSFYGALLFAQIGWMPGR